MINVNIQNKNGNTSLHDAARNGHKECVSLLLNHPLIDVTIRNKDGKTAKERSSKKEILDLFDEYEKQKKKKGSSGDLPPPPPAVSSPSPAPLPSPSSLPSSSASSQAMTKPSSDIPAKKEEKPSSSSSSSKASASSVTNSSDKVRGSEVVKSGDLTGEEVAAISLSPPSAPAATASTVPVLPLPLPVDFVRLVRQSLGSSLSLPPALPRDKTFHVFLTHNWAKDDSGRSNHARVSRVNQGLKALGFITWFDEDRMTGTIRLTMSQALYQSAAVICFITREYERKINSGNAADNCFFEFNIASNHHDLVNHRIPAVMEEKMLNPATWEAALMKAELGGLLTVDMTKDEDEAFIRQCAALVLRICQTLTK